MKKMLIILIAVVLLLLGGSWLSKNFENTESKIVTTNGMHRHPVVEIYIKGEKQEIPANIGLVGAHNPMHTHETDGVVHLEYSGIVREDDIRLGKFFELWGKNFSENQILDEVGEVRMFVNGEQSTMFRNYVMEDGDLIEIRLD